jgi:hypothetical protein
VVYTVKCADMGALSTPALSPENSDDNKKRFGLRQFLGISGIRILMYFSVQ